MAWFAEKGMHYQVDGTGLPVLFANSLGTDLRLWDALLPHLPPGLRLIRYDKRGHGLSETRAPFDMADLIADAAALLDHLETGPALIVGLSIGGLIAQGLAAARPDLVRALVLSNTAAQIGTQEMWAERIATLERDGMAALADPILERWFAPAFRAHPELALWRNMLCRTSVAGYAGCCKAIAGCDLRASTAALRLPVLAIAGAEDGSTPPDLVRGTAALIPGARLIEIPATGHLPCVEAPARYGEILTQFLQEVPDV